MRLVRTVLLIESRNTQSIMEELGFAEVAQDKRKLRRVRIALPIRVRGVNTDGIPFEEITRSVDVSPNGALFLLKRDLKKGMRLHLSLPLPRSMQNTAASKPVFETDAIVVRIEPSADSGTFRVAVQFRDASSRHYHRDLS